MPDISFPRHLDHGQYELDYWVVPKSLAQSNYDLEKLVKSGDIDKVQMEFFIKLCKKILEII